MNNFNVNVDQYLRTREDNKKYIREYFRINDLKYFAENNIGYSLSNALENGETKTTVNLHPSLQSNDMVINGENHWVKVLPDEVSIQDVEKSITETAMLIMVDPLADLNSRYAHTQISFSATCKPVTRLVAGSKYAREMYVEIEITVNIDENKTA